MKLTEIKEEIGKCGNVEELSAEEALLTYNEICCSHQNTKCEDCELRGLCGCNNDQMDVNAVLKVCKEWKKKKNPEVEWVWEVSLWSNKTGFEEGGQFRTEEEAVDRCEKYCIYRAGERPRAKYNRICRVKE